MQETLIRKEKSKQLCSENPKKQATKNNSKRKKHRATNINKTAENASQNGNK